MQSDIGGNSYGNAQDSVTSPSDKGGEQMIQISLKAARVNADLTINEASAKLGISNKTLINWEKGKTDPSASQLLKLVSLYGIPAEALILPKNLA